MQHVGERNVYGEKDRFTKYGGIQMHYIQTFLSCRSWRLYILNLFLSLTLKIFFNVCPFDYTAVAVSIRRNEAAIEICMHDVTDFRRPYTVLESTTHESKTSLFPTILYMGSFFRASKYWPYTASNSVHHFLPNNNTNSRFPP